MEGELFGHCRGAFTGADRQRRGKILSSDGGTLFLDGVDQLSPPAQTRLLRVIQEREVLPLGESLARGVDFRLVSSVSDEFSNRLDDGQFRRDLYYRINVIQLELPPLRQRPDDVPVLARVFLDEIARRFGKSVRRIEDRALRVLRAFDWPGNVRELRSVLECAVASARGETLRESDLPVYLRIRADRATTDVLNADRARGGPGPASRSLQAESVSATPVHTEPLHSESLRTESFHERVQSFQRKLIVESLREHQWSYQRAAAVLGLSHHQLKYLCAKLGIRRARFES
jgi:transcriptional regulator with GAF, ATPase, and Fis domain